MSLIQTLNDIASQIEERSNFSSQELSNILKQIRQTQISIIDQNLQLSDEIIIQKLLAQTVKDSSLKVINNLMQQMRLQKLFKIEKLFNTLKDNNYKISSNNIKLVSPINISLSPDLLTEKHTVKRTKQTQETEHQNRVTTAPAHFKPNSWEQLRKEKLLAHLSQKSGQGYFQVLLSTDITQTVLNIFNASQLFSEGKICLQNVQDGDNIDLQTTETLRIFVQELDLQLLKERKGHVFQLEIDENSFQELVQKYGNEGCFTF